MKDQTETPLTGRRVARRSQVETAGPAVADLEAELANLRLLIRRQDEVVERLLSERATASTGPVSVQEDAATSKRAKRSTRRGLLTQLAAGAAGVAAAAVYGTTKADKANAEFFGTAVGASTAQWGVYAYPSGVTPVAFTGTAGVLGQRDSGAPSLNEHAGVIGIANSGLGVFGQSTLASGIAGRSTTNFGVSGVSTSGIGAGGVSTSNYGVKGESSSNYGVYGVSASNVGVYGLSSSFHGVYGTANSGNVAGVHGEVFHSSGIGVWGRNPSGGVGVQGSGSSGPGVLGNSTDAPGVRGTSVNQPGVDGVSTNSLGIRGTSTNFVGIVGISTNNHGLYGSSNKASAFGIVAENLAAGGGGLFVQGNSIINGSLQVIGAKNAILRMADGTDAAVYCQESPEPYFEDFGRSQLAGGVANVPLEREFAQLVAGGDYMVFTHPEGDTRGLFISQRSANGFQVREVQGGAGNVAFAYRIVTKRKDIEGRRFARVDLTAMRQVAATRAALGVRGPNVAPTPGFVPQAPAPAPQPAPAPNPQPATDGAIPSPGLTVRPAP